MIVFHYQNNRGVITRRNRQEQNSFACSKMEKINCKGGQDMSAEQVVDVGIEKEPNIVFTKKEEKALEKQNMAIEQKKQQFVEFVGASCVEEGSLNILLNVKNYLTDEYEEVSIPRDKFTPKLLEKEIVNHNGIPWNTKALTEKIMDLFMRRLVQGTLFIKNFHECLGWHKRNKKYVFYGNNAISVNSNFESTYSGELDIQPAGDIENIRQMIREWITSTEEWSPLEAIIAVAVASTVLGYGNLAWNLSMNNVLVHLVGASSTGKSTSLMLFVALGSNPNPKKGHWINYASSEVSIVKRIGNNNGYPVALDELGSGGQKKYSTLVYTIGNGEEKDRLTTSGREFQDSSTFQTIVLSSGELSLIKKCSKDGGIRARCVELPNVEWTNSKEQSIAIKECLKNNYGMVTPMVAQQLIENDTKWKERLDYWKEQVTNKCTKENVKLSISERIADYVALFTLSAEIANVILDIDLNVDKIFDFYYDYIIIANEAEGNIAMTAHTRITDYIAMNKEKFGNGCFLGNCRTVCDGIELEPTHEGFYHDVRKKTIDGEVYDYVCVFRPGVLQNIILQLGFSDANVVLYQMRKQGYLKTKDKSRNTYPYRINDYELKDCIAVYVKRVNVYEDDGSGYYIEDEFNS